MKIVNKNELIAAHLAKQLIQPALDSLRKINAQSVGSVENYEKITTFGEWLETFVAKADAITVQAQSQFDARPQHLINAAALRFFAIPSAIELAEKTIQGLTEAHAAKCEVMRRQSFSESEIKFIAPFPQTEIDGQNSAIAQAKAERKSIEKYLGDSPRYDASLLVDAKLEPYLQHHNSAE